MSSFISDFVDFVRKEPSDTAVFKALGTRSYFTDEPKKNIFLEALFLQREDLAKNLFFAFFQKYIHKKMKLRGLSIDRHLTFDEEYAAALIVMKNKVKALPALKHNYRRAADILYRRGVQGSVITSVLQNFRISDF